jgi:hypothetical protein
VVVCIPYLGLPTRIICSSGAQEANGAGVQDCCYTAVPQGSSGFILVVCGYCIAIWSLFCFRNLCPGSNPILAHLGGVPVLMPASDLTSTFLLRYSAVITKPASSMTSKMFYLFHPSSKEELRENLCSPDSTAPRCRSKPCQSRILHP